MGIHDYWEDGNAPDWEPAPKWDPDPEWVEEQEEVDLVFDMLVHTTEKAYLLQFDEENVWFPKSKSTLNMSMHKNTARVPMWLVIQKGLEDYITNESTETTETKELFDKVIRKNIKKLREDCPF
jgi:hypothetical protein